ncbi:hypothetical protein NQ176_g8541 [Zarea fungicola]|uniref:Uncharacterized protein n=1 Tax=Zarea fungicola TaxID=93591 RepID=A0ACC1MSL3_9HYPO|nr:hypothetical protein NQ176_g8541 [Lecanicillium fungicola]
MMAPIDRVDHDGVEQQLKDIIQDLYQIMVQVSTYDSMGRPSKDVLSNEIKSLSRSLQTLHTTASPPHVLPSVPPELLEYVENGRNPDIYTREFVELVRRGNQLMRGKMHAFGSFRDVLAQNIATAMPELRDDVVQVLEATGGSRDVLSSNGATAPPAASFTSNTTTGNDGAGQGTAAGAQTTENSTAGALGDTPKAG